MVKTRRRTSKRGGGWFDFLKPKQQQQSNPFASQSQPQPAFNIGMPQPKAGSWDANEQNTYANYKRNTYAGLGGRRRRRRKTMKRRRM